MSRRSPQPPGAGFVDARLVAFVTAVLVGGVRIVFSWEITSEMQCRGAPGVLDLGVAYLSGVVAAYAFGRPHLLSVLPGIAIATSLVPPVATAGMSLTALRFDVALGATLLLLALFLAGFTLFTNLSWLMLMDHLGRQTLRVCGWLFGLWGRAGDAYRNHQRKKTREESARVSRRLEKIGRAHV